MEITQILKEIGLEEQETKIYLFLLKQGPRTQQQISNETGIIRQTVYDIIRRMQLKGYVSMSTLNKKKLCIAAEPPSLLVGLREKASIFEKVIPKLKELRSDNEQLIQSKYFIGMTGLKELFALSLDSKTDVLWFASEENTQKLFKDYYWENYALKRAENKVPLKLLLEKRKKPYWKTDKSTKREVRRTNLAKNEESSFFVFDDKTVIFSALNEAYFGVYVESLQISNMFRKIFNFLWATADKS